MRRTDLSEGSDKYQRSAQPHHTTPHHRDERKR